VNAPGTIDADYRGEVKVALINLGRENEVILAQAPDRVRRQLDGDVAIAG
jgi:dUTP pyrophosphatase